MSTTNPPLWRNWHRKQKPPFPFVFGKSSFVAVPHLLLPLEDPNLHLMSSLCQQRSPPHSSSAGHNWGMYLILNFWLKAAFFIKPLNRQRPLPRSRWYHELKCLAGLRRCLSYFAAQSLEEPKMQTKLSLVDNFANTWHTVLEGSLMISEECVINTKK